MLLTTGVVVVGLLCVVGAARAYGARRWRTTTAEVIERLQGSRSATRGACYDESEIEGLPAPVSRYFRTVLRHRQPAIVGARLVQEGRFRTGDGDNSWRPFVATQVFRAAPPGFVWDARIRSAPGVHVCVRDSYVAGAGSMRGEILGLVPVVDVHDTPEIAAGALQRYLAEAMWLPTKLLPSQGISWSAIDDNAARAALTDGRTSVCLEFRFSAQGDILGVFTPSRFRLVGKTFQPTPWEAVCIAHEERNGMRIPLEVEVAWCLADRRLPYWRGRVTEIAYDYAL